MMINEDYFIKYLKNELTEEETGRLLAWIRENRENKDFLFSLKESYQYLNYEKDKKEADTNREWQSFAKRIGLAVTPKGTKMRLWKRALAYAAVTLFGLFLGWTVRTYLAADSFSGTVLVETEAGQQAKTVLPDGSTVLLNACSKLTYSASDWMQGRNVHLEGEAIFDVKHQEDDQPFRVHTRHYDIHVLGTNFNVLSYRDEAKDIVTLRRGKIEVDVAGDSTSTVLSPGDSFVYDNHSGIYRVERRPLHWVYAWEHNEILFEGHTLAEKKEELARHFGYKFQIAPELQTLRFKATLRDESLNEFLSVLGNISPQLSYQVDVTNKVVTLVKTSK